MYLFISTTKYLSNFNFLLNILHTLSFVCKDLCAEEIFFLYMAVLFCCCYQMMGTS